MRKFIVQSIDRWVIRSACKRQAPAGRFPARHEEAMRLFDAADFFGGFVQAPKRIEWISDTVMQFPSPVESAWPETNIVHGQFFRSSEKWCDQPTVVLVHGWNDEYGYKYRQPVMAKKILSAGMNCAMIELPIHMQRRPRPADAIDDFISEDIFSSMFATHQAICDVRAMLAWIESQGCRRICLWGVSLGGWISGLVATHDARVNSLTLVVPAARLDVTVAELAFCAPLRRSLQGVDFNFERLNLRSYRPKAPSSKVLLIKGEYDLFVSGAAIEELHQQWNCQIWRIPHGHISGLFSRSLMDRTVEWMADAVGR